MGRVESRAVVLLSGGLDSAVCLAMARLRYSRVFPLFLDYGQPAYWQELKAAEELVEHFDTNPLVVERIPLAWPEVEGDGLAYVPARNTILLSLGLALAEIVGAQRIIIGVCADDHDYPDCRPGYFRAWQTLANVATATNNRVRIDTPLLYQEKRQVLGIANNYKVPLDLTFSCLTPDNKAACGKCYACRQLKEAMDGT